MFQCTESSLKRRCTYVLDGFIDAFQSTFSAQQTSAVICFRDELEKFCNITSWEPAEVLVDPQWVEVRHRAADFVQAFSDRWLTSTEGARKLLDQWMQACAEKSKQLKS